MPEVLDEAPPQESNPISLDEVSPPSFSLNEVTPPSFSLDEVSPPSFSLDEVKPPASLTPAQIMARQRQSRIAEQIPKVMQDTGIDFQASYPGLNPSESATLNQAKQRIVLDQAERRANESPITSIVRGARDATVGLVEGMKSPEGAALLGLSVVQPELGLPATAVRLAQAANVGIMSGLAAKTVGAGMGTITGGETDVGNIVKEELGMALTTVGAKGAAELATRADLAIRATAPLTAEALKKTVQEQPFVPIEQPKEPNAEQISSATSLHGDVQQPGVAPEGGTQVPTDVSGTRVQPSGQGETLRGGAEGQVTAEGQRMPVEPLSEGPGLIGMGAAAEGDFPSPPQAKASAAHVEDAPQGERPSGVISTISTGFSQISEAFGKAKDELGLIIRGLAGESLPRTTEANMGTGESGVRYASSKLAARPLATVFSTKTLEGTGVDPVKFGAALVEDNLRSIREWFKGESMRLQSEGKIAESEMAQKSAEKVATIIGSEDSPFKTEDQYHDYLERPEVKQAVAQHIEQWQEVVDPMYRNAMSIDPDVELATRGQNTGARVNLKVVFPDEQPVAPVRGVGSPSLTSTFKRKSPFAVKAKGTGETYETNYHEIIANTFERQLEIANKNAFDKSLVDAGLAEIHRPGWTGTIGGERAVAFPLKRGSRAITTKEGDVIPVSSAVNLYVKESLAREYRGAANVDSQFRIPGVTAAMGYINRTALAGLTDFTVHTSNLMTALFNRPISGKLWSDTLLSATGRLDAPMTLVKAILKAGKDNQGQWSELLEIGAGREAMQGKGILGFSGKLLKGIDKTTRLMLDDTYQSLADQGLVEKSETARREYVNQVGQYNRRLQGPLTRFLRDTGFGPFATAGKTFNALGVKMATLSPGVKAATPQAAAALRLNALTKWTGAAVFVGTMNYLLTANKGGGVSGRPGTPIGKIDTGLSDSNDKPLTFPFFDVMGLGRGLRVVGARGFIESKRLGLTTGNALDSAARDILNSAIGPAAGPPVRFVMVAGTGYPAAVSVGRASPVAKPGTSQALVNVTEALKEANPVVASLYDLQQGKSVQESLSRQLPRFTLTPGKPPEMIANYPRIVGLAQTHAYADDIVGRARKMNPKQRRAFIEKSLEGLTSEQRDMVVNTLSRRRVSW